jgi:hypothetical protein
VPCYWDFIWRRIRYLFLTSLVSLLTLAPASTGPRQQPVEWSRYDFHQFIAQDRTSPQTILGMDDNGRLALIAAGGIGAAGLRRVTGANASQIQLLVEWRLLARDGDQRAYGVPHSGFGGNHGAASHDPPRRDPLERARRRGCVGIAPP